MPRAAADESIEAIINDAVAAVVVRTVASLQKAIAAQVAVASKAAPRMAPRRVAARRRARPARQELTKWVADIRARRVPNFVIEATGLDTKKKIVAKFGENAAFEKGKALPTVQADLKSGTTPKAARMVKARAPVVRKAPAAK